MNRRRSKSSPEPAPQLPVFPNPSARPAGGTGIPGGTSGGAPGQPNRRPSLRIDPPASDSKSGPEKFGDILGKLFAARGWGRQQERNRLERAWAESVAEVAGADVPIHTRVLGLKRGLLEVEVDSPVRLQELAQFHKRRLLEQLRSRMGGTTISDLRFRVGVWKTKGA